MTLLRRLRFWLLCTLVLALTCTAAQAVPVYHLRSETTAPYEESAVFVDASPFADDAALLRVDVVNIRQGDCIVLYAGGETMLIDGGLQDRFEIVAQYMREHQLDGFDYVFLTHAHPDHLEVQEELVKAGYRIGRVISPYDENTSFKLWQEYRALLDDAGIPYEQILSGEMYAVGEDAVLTFYQRVQKGLTINDQSMAAMLQFGDARMFLASDITCTTQDWFLKQFGADAFACDIYKSAHHGLGFASSDFLDAMSPSACVVTHSLSRTQTHDRQLARRSVARYYIPMGTVHMETDGSCWVMWQEDEK